MDREQRLLQQVDRGSKARRLLDDPFLQEVLGIIEATYRDTLVSASIEDVEGIMGCKMMLLCHKHFVDHMRQAAESGKIAERQLENLKNGVSYLGDVWQSRRNRPK